MSNGLNTFGSIRTLLEANKVALAQRLPKHLSVDRMLKVALTSFSKTPKLLLCTKESLMLSILQAAELGLECGGALGEGYLVPYGTTCQFIPGYRGMINLARRSGEILSIEAHVVYQKDEFKCVLGLDPDLQHTPAWEEEDPGPLRFAYAVAKLKDGGTQFEVMSRAQISLIRNRSKAANSGPWVTDFDEMAKKTVVRRLFKYLPCSVEMAAAYDLQKSAESGDFSNVAIDGEVIQDAALAVGAPPPEPAPSKLKAALIAVPTPAANGEARLPNPDDRIRPIADLDPENG